MMKWLTAVGLVSCVVASGHARRCRESENLVTSLPGIPDQGYFNSFCQYSGYIHVGQSHTEGKRLFYWLTESQSADPDNDPFVLWLNGGPGCSSLGGFLSELGPYRPSKGGKSLREYPHSWNRIANVLFLESPAGVGFSDSDNTDDYVTGDAQTTKDAHVFLLRFLEKYPHYQGRKFYISGESYAGHYIPLLAQAIVHGNRAGLLPKINLQGYLVGNPSTDSAFDGYGEAYMWYSHNLISGGTFAGMKNYCGYADVARQVDLMQRRDLARERRSVRLDGLLLNGNLDESEDYSQADREKCSYYNNKAHQEMSGLINIYDIYVDVCRQHPHDATKLMHELGHSDHPHSRLFRHKPVDEKYRACLDNWLPEYLNRKDVRRALHIDENAAPWQQCSTIVEYSRVDHMQSMMPVHKELILEGLQVLVYSGDVDAILPSAGTRFWINALGFEKQGPWRHWTVDGQAAGFFQEYERGLTFATIRDAGHMCPETQPQRSFALFSRFITNGHLLTREEMKQDEDEQSEEY